MTTSAQPLPATESVAAYAMRGRRQTVAVFAVATLFGLWLGTAAPAVSPVATPSGSATQNAVTQAPAVPDSTPLDPRGPFGQGRGR